jgi:hypothetical protein
MIIGLALIIFAGRIFDREYFIGIFHGAGIVTFLYAMVANVVAAFRTNKNTTEQ